MPLGDTERMLLLEVGGRVLTFEDSPTCEQADLALDLKPLIDDFHRAFGIAVHPRFAENREVFVVYAGNPVARPDGTRLSRFKMTLDPVPQLDPASEQVLLTWASGGHNGCAIRFDAQGYLYFSAGDGARPFPPDEYDVGQDLSDLRSTICRIDVDQTDGELNYAIPPDNPFVNTPGARPEIWAYGFRNPWRFSIDPKTQQLLCGDVGWELWELVFHVERGGNYGWSLFEGPQPIRSDIRPGPTPIRQPLVAYPHTEGLSITGGFTYHGPQLEELDGCYLYGDYVTGLLWGLRFEGQQVTWNQVLAETGLPIITFAESREGEALVVSFDGRIFQLERNDVDDQAQEFPEWLSQTGLFSSTARLKPASGVYEYSVAATAWQDADVEQFLVGVPDMGTIITNRQKRNWQYPANTVFAKTLVRNVSAQGQDVRRRIETQLLHFNGISWQPYCYAWNKEQTDAQLVDAAGTTSRLDRPQAERQQNDDEPHLQWRHHARSECRACHSRQSGGAVAFSYENLLDSQRLIDLSILDKAPPAQWRIRSMVNPLDISQPIEERARSYLAANCAHCHCRGGGGTVALDLSYFNQTANINAVDYPTTQGNFGIAGAKVITPGDPYRSVLYYRMATSGTGHMPKLWQRENDPAGLLLVHDWIRSLPTVSTAAESALANTDAAQHPVAALRQFTEWISANEDVDEAAAALTQQANAVTVGLFERFLPANRRPRRLGSQIDAKQILSLRGNAQRGRKQFLTSQVLQCRNCHRLAGQGDMVGPDLDGIGSQRSRGELLDSILRPSARIEPKFATVSLVTVDDQVLVGLQLDRNAKAITLKTAEGKTHVVPHDDILHATTQTNSLMPQGLAAEMTQQQLVDLLEFLVSLKDR